MEMNYQQYTALAVEHEIIPVYKVFEEDCLTPIGIFNRLSPLKPSYILESVGDPKDLGRYSFIGLDSQMVTGLADIMGFEAVQHKLAKYKAPQVEALPKCYASIIGYMAYNAIEDIQPITLKHAVNLPKYQFLFSKTVVAIDHLKHQLIIIHHVTDPEKSDYERAMAKIDEIYGRLSAAEPAEAMDKTIKAPLVFRSNFEKADYRAAVDKIKDYIKAGDVFQVVLSQKFTAKGKLDGFSLYRNLRKENPSPYLSYIRFPDVEVLCSSPEMLVRMDDEVVETAPIAGTRAVKNDGKDDFRAKELSEDAKDLAEHLMLVDLGRNDIGKVSQAGTVTVAQYCEVKCFSKVMHLVSSVKGVPRHDITAMDGLRATFPAGTVSGAPKLRAMEIIDELEPDSRDLYAGAIVLMNAAGHVNSCISIRTIQLRDNQVIIQAGGGIVHDSVPDHEYLEVLNKSRAMFNAIEKTYKGEVTYDFDYR
ncbi:MAG: anthranilate synthase component I family protein [Clostridia bacterium]|nr:anthranilate synthase component I family protein [Clostridia bacterium]